VIHGILLGQAQGIAWPGAASEGSGNQPTGAAEPDRAWKQRRAKSLKPVLVGDPNPDRFKWLKDVLDEEYGTAAEQARTFDEVQKLVEESNKSRENAEANDNSDGTAGENSWSLIFITDNLPPKHTRNSSPDVVKTYFTILDSLNKWGDLTTVFVMTRHIEMDWRAITPSPLTIRLSDPPRPEERQSVIGELDGLGGLKHVAGAESKIAWDRDDLILYEQIRGLSDWHSLQNGENHLARLISRCFDCSKVEQVEVKQLSQGRSGATVFHLCVAKRGAETNELEKQDYVLKLCQAGSVWKLESEVRGHMQAIKGLGHPGYRVHIPALKAAHVPCAGLEHLEMMHPNGHIVRSGQWYAVHYDFLGGPKFGQFIDLEAALVASAQDLAEKLADTEFAVETAKARKVQATRARILETVLEWLCENWYSNSATGYVERKATMLWDSGDAPEQEYVVMPPYKLTGKLKGWIQSFLNSREADIGHRFFAGWAKQKGKVFRLVSEETPSTAQLGRLGDLLPTVLSQVHGDLNASNILLWVRHRHPFLIDFPFYQEAGHALQDFARLEVEIKFALLDRQRDSPKTKLRAFEHTYSQLGIWREMEDALLDQWDQKIMRWRSKGYAGNVRPCYELVQMVRRKAREVQQSNLCPGPPPGDFLTEYWPALLYHTVRAIGYPSLSLFKRLLAVYSAGSILTKLDSFPEID
jgi:hypothetical protein